MLFGINISELDDYYNFEANVNTLVLQQEIKGLDV